VQRAAVYALMNVQDPRIVAPLIALLKDDNVRIQACAKKILNEVAKRYCVNGEVNQAIEVFKVLHQQQSDTEIINNLLYCYIILKRYEEASALNNLLDCSKENKLSPILQHNRGILEFIMGHVKRAEAYLRTALESIREQGFDHEEAMCMLLLDGHGHATSEIELPIEAACLLNLHQSGAMSFDEVSQKLYNRFPDKHLDLIAKIDNRR